MTLGCLTSRGQLEHTQTDCNCPRQEGDGRETRVLEFLTSHPSFPELRGNPPKILAAMDTFAATQDFLISVGPDKERILTEIIHKEKPRVLVEVGGYIGYSAILFADAMRRAVDAAGSSEPAPHVWSLEFRPDYAAVAAEVIDIAGLSEFVTIVTGPAEESLRRLQAEGTWKQGVDVLFLDHVEDLYVQDLKVCEELGLLKAGTLVLADNVVRPGAPDYVKYVRAHGRYESHGVKGLIIPGESEVCFILHMLQNSTNCCGYAVG